MRLSILLTALAFSCSQNSKLDGTWAVNLKLAKETISFDLEIKGKKAFLYNNIEKLELDVIKNKEMITLPLRNYNAALEMKLINNKLKGRWIKYDRTPTYEVPLIAIKTKDRAKTSPLPINFAKKWKIDLFEDGKLKESSLLVFTITKDHQYASVLSTTGDYRYLTPSLVGNQLTLQGFDGIFSFKFVGTLEGNKFSGKMHAGPKFSQDFIATTDNSFKLTDPTSVTKIDSKSLNICLPDINDKKQCINTFTKKVKVIQLFGSWCPNCIDETKFIKQYRKDNKNLNIDFSIISFERSKDKKSAIKALKKTRDMYKIDYPILIGGYTKETKVGDVLKGIDNFISFPTTIIIDKKGIVREVHSGFSGPATGIYFKNFKDNFHALLTKLQAE